MNASRASVRAYVGLGSNLDDPAAQVRAGLRALGVIPDTRVLQASRLYRSPPWGLIEQPEFVNAVAELQTALTPSDLLRALQDIEHRAGRARIGRWGPRVLDLDLLLHDQTRIEGPGLQLPHPHLHERAFVLRPLADIAPGLSIPGHGTVEALLAAVDCAGVEALG